MASNDYAKTQPSDNSHNVIQNAPAPYPSLARFYRDNGVTSSIQTLTDSTTRVEVSTGGAQGAIIRWIPATETAAAPAGSVLTNNFDHFIPANTTRWFVVPKETQGVTSIVGINVKEGLYKRMAVANLVASSVFTSEF